MVLDVVQGQAEETEQAGEMGQVLFGCEFAVGTVLAREPVPCEFAVQELAVVQLQAPFVFVFAVEIARELEPDKEHF